MSDNEQTLGLVQQELDLTGETLETFWNRRSQEEGANWTEEALCVQWLCPKSAPDWDWWHGLRRYEREAWLNDYRHGRFLVESGLPMPSATTVYAARQERWKQTKAVAESWSKDVRKAFKEGRPCPIVPTPPFELSLDMAIDLAGIPARCMDIQRNDQTT